MQTNCLTEIFIEQALARAKEVDDYLKKNGKPIGPFHGLPISLKDQFCIKGMETVMGKYTRRETLRQANGDIIQATWHGSDNLLKGTASWSRSCANSELCRSFALMSRRL